MTAEDPSGYLPPHELRALGANLIERDDPHPPGPSVATASSPGLAGAAASPTGAAPTLPADDPASIALAIARIAGELFGGASIVPVPAPEHAATAAGLAPPASPGVSPSPALAPPAPAWPSADDPASIALAIARIASEPFGGASVVPAPAPEHAAIMAGLAPPMSPGISPALAPSPAGPPSDTAAAPQATAAPAATPWTAAPVPASPTAPHAPAAQTAPTAAPAAASPTNLPHGAAAPTPTPPSAPHAGAPTPTPPTNPPQGADAFPTWPPTEPSIEPRTVGARRAEASVPSAPDLDASSARYAGAPEPGAHNGLGELGALGSELRVPFTPTGEIMSLPAMDIASTLVPPLGGTGATMSPPGAPAFASPPAGPAVPEFPTQDARLSLLGDAAPSSAITLPEATRAPIVEHVSSPQPHWLSPDVAGDLAGHPGGEPAREPVRAAPPGAAAVRPAGGTAFDPHLVRRDFPILEERVHGKRLVWLDNAATTQKPRAVIDRLSYYYEHENSNVHRAAHALAARATDAYESARETTRKFLNAPSASEIVFVRGATEGINLIAKSWGRRNVERGDEIVLTHLEHHANIVPWQQLCAEVGARLRVAPVDDRGDVILEAYEKLLCSRTRLVAFTQVSNALGTVTPAREMIEIAHRRGATVLLDGAQAVSHMAVDVQALDCDFYVFSGHKVFAPTGIGAVFGKRGLLDAMPPWQGGGNMIADVTFERTLYQAPPWRFEAGTGNIADAAGLGAALDYVLRIGMSTIDRYEHELLAFATERLGTVPGLRIIGSPRHKAGVLSFVLDGRRTEDVGAALDKDGIAVRSGHHCAQPILRRYGLESTVRASLAFYNTYEDIDALVAALCRLQSASV